jgi:hypothetical protein
VRGVSFSAPKGEESEVAVRLGVAETDNSDRVDLGLDEGGVLFSRIHWSAFDSRERGRAKRPTHVKVSLGSDLDADVRGGRLGIPDGLL